MDEKEKDRGGGPGLRPLTPEHRHLLRMKAYSFPFLCEKSWSNCDDEDDDDGRGELVADEVIEDCGKSDLGANIVLCYVSKSFDRRNFMQNCLPLFSCRFGVVSLLSLRLLSNSKQNTFGVKSILNTHHMLMDDARQGPRLRYSASWLPSSRNLGPTFYHPFFPIHRKSWE